MLDNTVIVFTSDHGEEFFEHGGCHHVETLYREVLHVPLLISAPGLPAGRIADLVPASVSISPTVLEAGTGNVTYDPSFVDPDNDDFHLATGSVLINIGTNSGAPAEDADGNTRARTTADPTDIGAYEYIE